MQTWALYSLKGGVGKTTTAVNLAWEAAAAGRYTLLWDLDPQAAASWYLGVNDSQTPKAKKLLAGKSPLGRFVQASAYPKLDVIAAHRSFRNIDQLLEKSGKQPGTLKKLLKPFAEQYHLLILDCPPSMSSLASEILAASDLLIVPTIPTPLSLRALVQVQAFAEREQFPAKRLRPMLSMADRRKRLHNDILDNDRAELANRLSVFISSTSDVERMGDKQAPVGCYAPRSAGALQFHALWRELSKKYGDK